MIVIGVMAFTALPRMDGLGAFDARGFADQTEAYLRYAQKSALAQRRQVRVELSNDTATAPVLCVPATYSAPCPGSCSGLTTLQLPSSFRAANGSTMSGAASFCFDTTGKPSAGQTITIRDNVGAVARTVIVEAETGYVH